MLLDCLTISTIISKNLESVNSRQSFEECNLAIELLLASEQLIRLLLEQVIQVVYQLNIRDYLESPDHASHIDIENSVVEIKTMQPTTMNMAAEMNGGSQTRRVYS